LYRNQVTIHPMMEFFTIAPRLSQICLPWLVSKKNAYTGFISKTYVCKWLFPFILYFQG
jgi:hypothetical protein